MRFICISDTHNSHAGLALPDGDVLIHAGDHSNSGTIKEVASFLNWIGDQPHEYKIFIAGNHDWLFERDPAFARGLIPDSVIYLQDSETVINGLKIYGSPWQPRFYDWAFNLDRGEQMAEKWRMIPPDTEILITHGPPNGILDLVPRKFWSENTGCEELIKRVDRLDDLKLHIFGHIHCGYGLHEQNGVTFINTSTCTEEYIPQNQPIIFDLK